MLETHKDRRSYIAEETEMVNGVQDVLQVGTQLMTPSRQIVCDRVDDMTEAELPVRASIDSANEGTRLRFRFGGRLNVS